MNSLETPCEYDLQNDMLIVSFLFSLQFFKNISLISV